MLGCVSLTGCECCGVEVFVEGVELRGGGGGGDAGGEVGEGEVGEVVEGEGIWGYSVMLASCSSTPFL